MELRERESEPRSDDKWSYNRNGLQLRGHAPSRLPVKKLRRLLHKRRKVRVFVWKGILKISFLAIPSYSQLIHNHNAEVYAPIAFFIVLWLPSQIYIVEAIEISPGVSIAGEMGVSVGFFQESFFKRFTCHGWENGVIHYLSQPNTT